jgi:dolichol-phosphate mannosyltransferase
MLSVISPMKNEEGNVERLVREVGEACTPLGAFELILVDDGSTDGTAEMIGRLQGELPWLRLLHHARSGGQSAAIHSGVLHARGVLCATLDGDGQNPPDQIPALVAAFHAAATPTLGLVAGQRVGRRDTISKKTASRLANWLRARLLKDDTRDTGCGLKLFRRDAYLALPFFNHMHRYLPALFKRDGWTVVHVDVTHRERGAGTSKYSNYQRALAGIYDLVGVAWLIRRRKTVWPVEADTSEGSGDA